MKRLPVSRMTLGVVAGALIGLVPTVLVATGADSPPDSPPVVTGPAVVSGSTWYSDGSNAKAGPAGTRISAYAVGALENVPYRLVLGLGASDRACQAVAQVLNPTVIVVGPNSLIGRVTGTVPASPAPTSCASRTPPTATSPAPGGPPLPYKGADRAYHQGESRGSST